MKQPRKYVRRAQRYRVLAKGYAALKSTLAGPAEAAAEAFEQMAHRSNGATGAGEPGRAPHEELGEVRIASRELQS